MRGPRSEPPMPRFTTSVMASPVKPCTWPARKASAKSVNRWSSRCTSAVMAAPQGADFGSGALLGLLPRNATCNTGRCSVALMASPWNMACACVRTWLSSASCSRACITAGVTRWREASAWMPAASNCKAVWRTGSGNKSRRCGIGASARACKACQAGRCSGRVNGVFENYPLSFIRN